MNSAQTEKLQYESAGPCGLIYSKIQVSPGTPSYIAPSQLSIIRLSPSTMVPNDKKPLDFQGSDAAQDVNSKLDEFHLGLNRMIIEKDRKSRGTLPGFPGLVTWGSGSGPQVTWRKASVVLRRLLREILPVATGPILFSVAGHVVSGIMPVVEGALEGRILRVVSVLHALMRARSLMLSHPEVLV